MLAFENIVYSKLTLLGIVAGSLAAVNHKKVLADINNNIPRVKATSYPPF
jgi:hypothetical protein